MIWNVFFLFLSAHFTVMITHTGYIQHGILAPVVLLNAYKNVWHSHHFRYWFVLTMYRILCAQSSWNKYLLSIIIIQLWHNILEGISIMQLSSVPTNHTCVHLCSASGKHCSLLISLFFFLFKLDSIHIHLSGKEWCLYMFSLNVLQACDRTSFVFLMGKHFPLCVCTPLFIHLCRDGHPSSSLLGFC